ncbi:hypothetical protein AVEN_74321-1 [Araneus ventricosus]|uniref:Uncharacterized protein n=1 Tax=Araneus ventricosus TaxID=182803 RepID=A0A4Y2HN21_ARAVE|nr:hypothetical protein AVEN_74321-1 [Araneus ventricosus]
MIVENLKKFSKIRVMRTFAIDAEQAYEEDFLFAEKYQDKYTELCSQIEETCLKDSSTKDFSEQRKFKLPKIELKKFDGNAKDYLAFWRKFRKIYEDSSIPKEDKFQYLLQAVVPKSKVARVVESFPVTADNYAKAISQLQERCGRDDLLVQKFVRDMLSMVMKNAATGRSKTDLPALYDEMEAKIRALESLVRTQEKYGYFLSPLMEFYLPEEVLVAWERNQNHRLTKTKESRTLEQLMNFLSQEVKEDEMVTLAQTDFASHETSRRNELYNDQVKQSQSITASALVSLQSPEEEFKTQGKRRQSNKSQLDEEKIVKKTPNIVATAPTTNNSNDSEKIPNREMNIPPVVILNFPEFKFLMKRLNETKNLKCRAKPVGEFMHVFTNSSKEHSDLIDY